MGIIDRAIQSHAPAGHVIVEAHPMVHAKMLADGWGDRPNVRCLLGRWQDVLPTLEDGSLDAIFFDTYGEHDADMVSRAIVSRTIVSRRARRRHHGAYYDVITVDAFRRRGASFTRY